MKKTIRLITPILAIILLFSGCSFGATQKQEIQINENNFSDYFDITASFDNLTTDNFMGLYSASCNANFKCVPKSSFDVESVEVTFSFETSWLTFDNQEATIYITNNSGGETVERISIKNHFGSVNLPDSLVKTEIISANGTIHA